jgi:hypothetical protein
MICPFCHGNKIEDIDFTIGLGNNGLVPSYVERDCFYCGGTGEVPDNKQVAIVKLPNRQNEYLIPDSFIDWGRVFTAIKNFLTK